MGQLGGELLVTANGRISREAFNLKDRAENFYMIGSMGLASAIGLGLAINRPGRKVVVLDGGLACTVAEVGVGGRCRVDFGALL